VSEVEVVSGEIVEPEVYPRVLHKGKYTLYEKADGTLRIQYRRDERDDDDFMEIPGFIIALGKQAEAGNLNPIQLMNEMQKYMRRQKNGN
jgi:hypothetical protein